MWKNVENNCKALYEYQFIDGNKPTERKKLIGLIAEEFPEYPRMRIAHAVDQCIKTVTGPMSATTFLSFVKGYLR